MVYTYNYISFVRKLQFFDDYLTELFISLRKLIIDIKGL